MLLTRRVGASLLLAWAACGLSGCAATMAAHQPGMKDLSVLQPGMPRSRVIAELGPPLTTHPTDRGGMDVFAFKQGYTRVNRAARALGHATGTVVTAGFWEIAGIPIEAWFDGTDVKLEVSYGPEGQVENVTVFEGAEAFRGRILGPHVQVASAPTYVTGPVYAASSPVAPPPADPPPGSSISSAESPPITVAPPAEPAWSEADSSGSIGYPPLRE